MKISSIDILKKKSIIQNTDLQNCPAFSTGCIELTTNGQMKKSMVYRGIELKKNIFPHLYQYELLGGGRTLEGVLYSEDHLDEIMSEINRISAIGVERDTYYGDNRDIHEV